MISEKNWAGTEINAEPTVAVNTGKPPKGFVVAEPLELRWPDNWATPCVAFFCPHCVALLSPQCRLMACCNEFFPRSWRCEDVTDNHLGTSRKSLSAWKAMKASAGPFAAGDGVVLRWRHP